MERRDVLQTRCEIGKTHGAIFQRRQNAVNDGIQKKDYLRAALTSTSRALAAKRSSTLKYDYAYRLKRDFPGLEIIINGGVKTAAEIDTHLAHVDGVMLGREAYHNPFLMAGFDARYYGGLDDGIQATREQVIEAMMAYASAQLALHAVKGLRLNSITRHMLGLMAGLPGARAFRQVLSDSKKLAAGDPALLMEALARTRQIAAQ